VFTPEALQILVDAKPQFKKIVQVAE